MGLAGASYFWLNVEGEPLCSQGASAIGKHLGSSRLRLNHEEWLEDPKD